MDLDALTDEQLKNILANNLGDWRWRINNLYKITNSKGEIITFKMNWAQEFLFSMMWFRCIILKARQLGMTTFVMIFMLDQCLFNANTKCGVVAHGLEEASDLFNNKIRFAYEQLPEWLRALIPTKRATGKKLEFENGSSIRVGTSMRSGTYQYLHISEFGKICRKYPERAKEIVTGSFPAAQDGVIFIESTAEGQGGYFFEYCEEARKKQLAMQKLTRKDFKFFFFPWFREPRYRLSDEDTAMVTIVDRLEQYFYQLEEEFGIELDDNQRAWYAKEEEILGADMKREHPSTALEAFEQAIEGAYFAAQFTRIYSQNRIGDFPYHPGVPVDTWWDLGMNDDMVIWFTQTVGGRIHVIDYYENNGEVIQHYIKHCQGKIYVYGRHYGPHDLEVRELFGDEAISRAQKAAKMGFKFVTVPRIADKMDAIEAARDALELCSFNKATCSDGIAKLERYRKQWDQKTGRWKDQPYHDDASNTADGFMTMATGHPMFARHKPRARAVSNQRSGRYA
ncbi:MAG: terminase [Gammaproteobacteria bacterium]|nr:terminase [Gammaproteobacteria bacterium]